MTEAQDLAHAVDVLVTFLGARPLTTAIADLEGRLNGLDGSSAAVEIRAGHVDEDLLAAAVRVRREFGRINDLIHAAGILLALPLVLEPGERIANRPSLAAGNDLARPYDLETDRRVAEFKLSNWAGRDAMRKRQVFKDLVTLAADTSGRRPELFIIGGRPERFLRTSKTTARWALDRFPSTQTLFEHRFGSLEMRVVDFTAGPGAHVRITDLTKLLPGLATVGEALAALDEASAG